MINKNKYNLKFYLDTIWWKFVLFAYIFGQDTVGKCLLFESKEHKSLVNIFEIDFENQNLYIRSEISKLKKKLITF